MNSTNMDIPKKSTDINGNEYGSRKYYASIFSDIFADISEEFHDPDNLMLGMYDAAFEWLHYHENCLYKYKLFIENLKKKTGELK